MKTQRTTETYRFKTPVVETTSTSIIFYIDPVPAPRMTGTQVKLLRIPDHKIRDQKLLTVKQRIVRYMEFKKSIQWMIKSINFTLPESDFQVIFWIETGRRERWGTAHRIKPDLDNLMKAFKDCLGEDKSIYDYRISKFWSAKGGIEFKPI
jgi:Holliday junction resolvase RusA-like endonuclease